MRRLRRLLSLIGTKEQKQAQCFRFGDEAEAGLTATGVDGPAFQATHTLGVLSEGFERAWALATGALCVLVMMALAFTGPVALIGVAVILTLSVGLRRLVRLAARHRDVPK